MASLPPQPSGPGQRRSSREPAPSSAETTSHPHSDTNNQPASPSTPLENSDNTFPNTPASWSFVESTSQAGMQHEQQQQQQRGAGADEGRNNSTAIQSPNSNNATADSEPRKCWICYADETEDTPLSSEWRSPCPCALTAHEACLLDWLADMENPKSRKRRNAKMLCPQCKSEIVISRPRSFVVDLVRAVERLAGRLVLPGMVFTLAGTVWAGCCAHGVYSMYFVFGSEDAQRIFDSGADATAWNPRLNLGLPMIPIVLIFSRTKYAEGLLPAIPVLFFATHHPAAGQELDMELWPPSAAMTFAALPYAKSLYNMVYKRLFSRLERKWIAEVQPRAGSDDGEQVGHDHDHDDHGHDGEILMEIDLELQLGLGDDDDDGEDHGVADLPPNQAQDQPAEGAAGANGEGQDAQVAGAGAQAQANQLLGRRQDEIIHETSTLADTVLGALLFPAISASMGGVLKMALPRSWTTPSPAALEKGKAGLLQSRWGRSVVGGCLFVLLKDALVLYCRWKLAQSHRKRRVLNYDRSKKQVVRP
ncbi:hypothetical protein AJ80_02614 [Polytolypa hystricis UAMH7299]|uniref:RING-CH-type domain-containing protein n=1 Tax=Polytolypa hystricis (strain UAMH7299) TaxID=1447883 RepID=A0A2B7YQN8_POLH7|nr:hypothetical protein AJ80_02614 [Polytolypa hystricis UAMH7299]